MKNYLLFFFMIMCNISISQTNQQVFGLRASASIANFYDGNWANEYHPRGLGYELALSTSLLRNNRLGFIAEMSYAQKNVKNQRFGYSLSYLSFNFLPNFYFYKSKTTVFLGGGAGIMVFHKIINNYPKSGEYFNAGDLGLIAGFNQQLFVVNGLKVDVDSRFSWGLWDTRYPFREERIQNYAFSVGLVVKKNAKKINK